MKQNKLEDKILKRQKNYFSTSDSLKIVTEHQKKTVNLRKSKRFSISCRRRNINLYVTESCNVSLAESLLGLRSKNTQIILDSISNLNILLTSKQNNFTESISSEFMHLIVYWLLQQEFPEIQYQSSILILKLTLTNNLRIKESIELLVIPALETLLDIIRDEILEIVLLNVANIAADSMESSLMLYQKNLHVKISLILKEKNAKNILNQGCLAISNMIIQLQSYLIPNLCYKILIENLKICSADILPEMLWSIYIKFNFIYFEDDLISYIVFLAGSEIFSVQEPALVILKKLIHEHLKVEILISAGAIKSFLCCINSKNERVKQKAILCVKSLCINNKCYIRELKESGIFKSLIDLLLAMQLKFQKKILIIIHSLVLEGLEFLDEISCDDLIANLCILLGTNDSELIILCLLLLENILHMNYTDFSEGIDCYNIFLKYKGTEILEGLQYHPNDFIGEKAFKILSSDLF